MKGALTLPTVERLRLLDRAINAAGEGVCITGPNETGAICDRLRADDELGELPSAVCELVALCSHIAQ